MIWFAWRQFRVQALIAFVLLLAVAIAFLVTGPTVAHIYHTTIVGCAARHDCNGAQNSFLSAYPFLQNLLTESELLAVLIGIFWGAPVVAREFDAGTYRLAWTQSASRTRWLATKMLVGALATVVTAGLFTLMATRWSSLLDRVRDQPFSLFDTRNIVPIGYALFAFVLGVAVGAVVRRLIPAMVLTIAGFAAVRGLFNFVIRPHLATVQHASFSFTSPIGGGVRLGGNINPADWTLSTVIKNAAGKLFPKLGNGVDFQPDGNGSVTFVGAGRCPNKIPGSLGQGGRSGPPKPVQEALAKCVNSFHLHEMLSYIPVSRYWSIQWYELSCYVVLSAILAVFSVWWIRRP
jgi:ABC-type transport system involved in multi-copper enzyme maturation permease subunit